MSTNAVQARAQQDQGMKDIRDMLNAASDRIGRALPKHLTPERMITVASTLIYRTPKLQLCIPNTIYAGVIRASSLGLDLEPRMCEAYLIPRYSTKLKAQECHFQLGFQGVRKLATNSGQVRFMQSELVFEGDEFEFWRSPAVHLFHRPRFGKDRGKVIVAYSYAKLASGEDHVEVMDALEIDLIRDRVKATNRGADGEDRSSPWDTDYGQMAAKTVTIRHGKSLPRSPELAVAIAWDSEAFADDEGASSQGRVVSVKRGRGLTALQSRTTEAASGETAFEPGVATPIYSEADEAALIPSDDDE